MTTESDVGGRGRSPDLNALCVETGDLMAEKKGRPIIARSNCPQCHGAGWQYYREEGTRPCPLKCEPWLARTSGLVRAQWDAEVQGGPPARPRCLSAAVTCVDSARLHALQAAKDVETFLKSMIIAEDYPNNGDFIEPAEAAEVVRKYLSNG